MKNIKLKMALILLLTLCMVAQVLAQSYPGFRVQGRSLYDSQGEQVALVGVNKMIIWMDADGIPSYQEIARTGANCVRIVWTTDGTPQQLDAAIYNCRANSMIPMVELHDATGVWSDLGLCVDYWVRPDIVSVIQEHQQYLLINIANECGDANVAYSTFRSDYQNAVQRMRNAGIHVPLIIDGLDWGKDIDVLQSEGPALIQADPDSNLMFSVHMWWPEMWGYNSQRVIDEIAESVNMNLPLIVGEFGAMWEESTQGQIPYATILQQCTQNKIGWLAWSWGPGNDPQAFLDMTEDGTYNTLHGWGYEVAISHQYSIQNTARRPASIANSTPPPTPTPVPIPSGNLALGRPVTTSSSEGGGLEGDKAVDGDYMATRWASGQYDPNWLYIDLGSTTNISRVIIWWEAAYAAQYSIQVSNDTNNWTDIYTNYNGDGGTDDISVSGSGRYVRIYGMQRYNTEWGYSIWEVAVYGSGGTGPTPTQPPVSNRGDVNNDGSVNIVDALMIAQYYVNLNPQGFNYGNADVNCDNTVTIVDALMVAQYYVGLIGSLNC